MLIIKHQKPISDVKLKPIGEVIQEPAQGCPSQGISPPQTSCLLAFWVVFFYRSKLGPSHLTGALPHSSSHLISWLYSINSSSGLLLDLSPNPTAALYFCSEHSFLYPFFPSSWGKFPLFKTAENGGSQGRTQVACQAVLIPHGRKR